MFATFIAFVNTHFSVLITGVATESSIASLIYGIVMNDMLFSVALIIVICTLTALANKMISKLEDRGGEIVNISSIA